MKHPRSVSALVIVAALLATLYLIADLVQYKSERDARSIDLGRQAGQRVAATLDAELTQISDRAVAYAREVAATPGEDELLESIRRESLAFPLLLGVTVAYEPGRFEGRDRYAPFFNKSRNEYQFVEETYDYTDASLETARWYTAVIESGAPSWSAPYYAEAAQAMVVDYGVPIFDGNDAVIGMVDYTISLSDFTEIVDTMSVGESGYGFTYDQNGAILTHPDPRYLMENVFQIKDGKTEDIVRRMRDESEGVVEYNSTYTYKFSWFFFSELESTGWKSVLVFTEDDLLGPSDQSRVKIIHIALGLSVLLVAILAAAFRVDRNNPHLWWRLVAGVSLIIITDIVVIWYLNLSTDFSLYDENQVRVVNQTIVNKHVNEFDQELHKLTGATYHKVPTGIFIESYELSSFEASLIGKIWMKYPKALSDLAPPAFYLPGVSAKEPRGLIIELISKVDHDDHMLITWKFRATLEQDFSYQQYPFEQNDIQVAILYPDLSKNILLVPDLASYNILEPSVKPGLSETITVPSSETISSFFSFNSINYKTTFGNHASIQSHPALVFNIAVKRIYLSPLIANIIPILIVALIMFIVLYVSSNRESDRSGLTTMNVIQSSAGFLFILVLAHVNERSRIETPEIAYIELFYFSMYVLVTLQSIALAMMFHVSGWKLYDYHDNLILKLLFWPLLLATWLIVTLVRFY